MSILLKKVTSAVSVVAIVASAMSSTLVANAASTFTPYADALATAGIIAKQSTEAGYNLGNNVTRAEMAKVAVNIKGVTVTECTGKVFSDVTSAIGDLCGYVEAAATANLVNKIASKFRPMDLVTRAEMLKMLLSAKGIAATDEDQGFQDLGTDASLNGFINAAAKAGIINKGLLFNPNNTASRGEAFKVAANSAGLTTTATAETGDDLNLGDLFGDTTDTTTGTTTTTTTGTTTTTTVVAAGDLEVALSPTSPGAKSIPQAGTVSFGTFDFTAGGSDISLNTVKMNRGGLGSRTDVNRVWMEKNGMRVSGRQSVGSDGTVFVTFSPALVVKAGSTESLDLVVSMSGASNSQHVFTIASASDVTSSAAAVKGTFPVSTASMTTTSYTVTPVLFSTGGTTSTYRVGDTGVELGQFKLRNDATDDKSVTFKAISLRNDGTGDMAKNLTNLAIYKNGAKISTAAVVDGKNVTFTVNDSVAFGRQETYYIRADIASVDNTTGNTYQFSLRFSDDLNVTEALTGFKSTVNGVTSSVSLVSYSVSGGDVILSKSTTAPSSQTVAPGTNDVVLLSADLAVAQPVNLQDLAVTLNTTGFSGATAGDLSHDFSSLKLVVGGQTVSTFTPSASTTSSFTFEGTVTVSKSTTIQILGNVRSGATGKYKLNDVALSAFSIKEYAVNGNTIQSAQIVGSSNGVSTTIGSATLTLTRNDGVADQALTIGSTSQTLMQFAMRANDVSDVTVTKLTFGTGAGSSGSLNTTNVTNVQLVVNGVVASTKSMSTGVADFNDINIKILKNTDATVKVVANFSTALTSGEQFKVALQSVEARDSNSLTLGTAAVTTLPVTGVLYTFVGAGTATLTQNSATPNAAVLTASAVETEVARYTLAATNDALQLTDLYVYNTGTADLSSRIKTIGLYDVNGTKLAGGSVLGTGTVQFSLGSTSSFVVAKNTSNSVVVVKASFNDITDGAQDATSLQLAVGTLAGVTVVDGTNNGVRLVSQSTGNTATGTTATAAISKTSLLVRSKPVIAVSGAATNSTHTFTVTADANNRITLSGVTLTLANPVNGPTSFILYKDQQVTGNEVATGTIASSGATVTLTLPLSTQVEISAGSTKTFILEVNGATTVAVNSKRIMKVTDISYIDMMNTGANVTISSILNYSNVGLPTSESTFNY